MPYWLYGNLYPIVKLATIRVTLSLTSSKSWPVHRRQYKFINPWVFTTHLGQTIVSSKIHFVVLYMFHILGTIVL